MGSGLAAAASAVPPVGWTRPRFRGSFPAKKNPTKRNEKRTKMLITIFVRFSIFCWFGFVFFFYYYFPAGSLLRTSFPRGSDVVFSVLRRKPSWGSGKLCQKQRLLAAAPVGCPSPARPDAFPAGSILRERSERSAAAGAAPLPPRAAPTAAARWLKNISLPRTRKSAISVSEGVYFSGENSDCGCSRFNSLCRRRILKISNADNAFLLLLCTQFSLSYLIWIYS